MAKKKSTVNKAGNYTKPGLLPSKSKKKNGKKNKKSS
jgi:hypothetical protein